MRIRVLCKAIVFISLLCLSRNGYGDTPDIDLSKIVVTPSRTEEDIQGTVNSVTAYTSKDIEHSKTDTIKDFIAGTLSLDIAQTGSFGGPVSVFLRGTNSNHNQIMIDNVRMYDPIAANGAFDLAHLTLDNVERIEVVRGPQSVLYGSDAIGGVVNIITRKGEGKPTSTLLTEVGTFDTNKESFDSSGRVDKLAYSFGVSHLYTRGISKFRGTSERDPYENTALSLRTDYDLNSQNTVGLISRFTNAVYDYDNSVGLKDDPNLWGQEQQTMVSTYLESKLTDIWKQKIQCSFMRNYRQDFNDRDESYPFDYLRDWYIGENQQVDWQHTIKLADFDTIICGTDWQREKGSYYYYTDYEFGSSEIHFPKVHSSIWGYYLQNLLTINDVFHFNTGIRIDDHSNFGTRDTYKVDASYLFKTGTKIKGSWGTAFKAPTLYQLHALPDPWFGGGNPNLQPEESQTYEGGFEQSAFHEKVKLDVVYFHTLLKNLIDARYDPSTWLTEQYRNVAKARIEGIETCVSLRPIKVLKIDSGYTWLDTEDKTNGDELLRRPRTKIFTEVTYTPFEALNVNLKVSYIGQRNDSANRVLKAYAKADVYGNYRINKNLETFIRIENITNIAYEEIKNYAEPGRSYYGGMKISF